MSLQEPSCGVLPEQSLVYLRAVREALAGLPPRVIAQRIQSLVTAHDAWRVGACLNLMASENTTSAGSRRLMGSFLGTRTTGGFPGVKRWPARTNVCIDEIEATIIALCSRLFGATYVEWRATSTTMANAIVMFALTRPGDVILVQSTEGGGNMNYHEQGIPRLRGLRVVKMPAGDYFGLDVAGVRRLARRHRPKLFVIGGSKVLFPYPLHELREIADEVGATILYDAAHVGGLIAGGLFQDPLRDGAIVLSTGTHKIMGGPVGGLVMTNDADAADAILSLTYPSFIQTHDQAQSASVAYTLAELLEYSGAYGLQAVVNARALATALEEEGFVVLARERGYTATHQLFVDLRAVGADRVEEACQASNILWMKTRLPEDGRADIYNGGRLSVQEVTRQGMREPEMRLVAKWMRRCALDGEPPERIAREVAELVASFQTIAYSFDEQPVLVPPGDPRAR